MKSTVTNEVSALHPAFLILLTIWLLLSAARPCAAQWAATYAGVGGADAEYIQQTRDGGYIVVAESNFIAGGQDFWVFKLAGTALFSGRNSMGAPHWKMSKPSSKPAMGATSWQVRRIPSVMLQTETYG
jgi:hypothetical protein